MREGAGWAGGRGAGVSVGACAPALRLARAPFSSHIFWVTRMKVSPMIFRFSSGEVVFHYMLPHEFFVNPEEFVDNAIFHHSAQKFYSDQKSY